MNCNNTVQKGMLKLTVEQVLDLYSSTSFESSFRATANETKVGLLFLT